MEYLSSLVLVTCKHCVLWIQSCVLICLSVHVCCRMIVHIQRDHALIHHRDLSRVRGSPAQPVTDRSLQNDHGQCHTFSSLVFLSHVSTCSSHVSTCSSFDNFSRGADLCHTMLASTWTCFLTLVGFRRSLGSHWFSKKYFSLNCCYVLLS